MAKEIREIVATVGITWGQIEEAKAIAERELVLRPELRRRFEANTDWLVFFRDVPGVYCLFDRDQLVYVGEAGNLIARMRNLLDTANHTFRRALGKHLFGGRSGFEGLRYDKRFAEDLEKELKTYMEANIRVTTLHVAFGRKEIEQHLIQKHDAKFCTHGRRTK